MGLSQARIPLKRDGERTESQVAILSVGEAEIEMLESTCSDEPVAKFIEKRGEGIQHISFPVENLVDAMAELKAQCIRFIEEKPLYCG